MRVAISGWFFQISTNRLLFSFVLVWSIPMIFFYLQVVGERWKGKWKTQIEEEIREGRGGGSMM